MSDNGTLTTTMQPQELWRLCAVCNTAKDISDFRPDQPDRKSHVCHACERKRAKVDRPTLIQARIRDEIRELATSIAHGKETGGLP